MMKYQFIVQVTAAVAPTVYLTTVYFSANGHSRIFMATAIRTYDGTSIHMCSVGDLQPEQSQPGSAVCAVYFLMSDLALAKSYM